MARGGLAHLLATLLLFLLLATPLAVGASEAEADPAAPAQGVSEAAAAPDADAEQQQHLLPRPLVIELPSARAAEEHDADADDVPPDVRCASWRLAAEANNLAPWKALHVPECAQHVRDYVTSAAYRSDLELVARESAAYARADSISNTAYARAATISSTAISFFLEAAAREARLHLARARSARRHSATGMPTAASTSADGGDGGRELHRAGLCRPQG